MDFLGGMVLLFEVPGFGLSETGTGFILGFLESGQLGACFSSGFFADFLEQVLDLEEDLESDLLDLERDLESDLVDLERDLERDLELLLELSMNSAEMGFFSFLGELGSGSVDRLDDRELGVFLYSLNLLLLRFWLSRQWLNFFSRFLTELST